MPARRLPLIGHILATSHMPMHRLIPDILPADNARRIRIGVAVAFALLANACGGGGADASAGPGTDPKPTPTVGNVSVSPTALSLVPTATGQVTASVTGTDGAAMTATVTWQSADETVARVSSTGLVTAVAAGHTSISASAGTKKGEIAVDVLDGADVGSTARDIVMADGHVKLSVPAGALNTVTRIVTTSSTATGDGIVAGTAYAFQPSGLTFSAPVQLTLTYDPAKLPIAEPNALLQVAHRDGASSWTPIPGTSDPSTHTVTAPIAGFSEYAVIARPKPAAFHVVPIDGRADRFLALEGHRSFAAQKDNGDQVVVKWSMIPADVAQPYVFSSGQSSTLSLTGVRESPLQLIGTDASGNADTLQLSVQYNLELSVAPSPIPWLGTFSTVQARIVGSNEPPFILTDGWYAKHQKMRNACLSGLYTPPPCTQDIAQMIALETGVDTVLVTSINGDFTGRWIPNIARGLFAATGWDQSGFVYSSTPVVCPVATSPQNPTGTGIWQLPTGGLRTGEDRDGAPWTVNFGGPCEDPSGQNTSVASFAITGVPDLIVGMRDPCDAQLFDILPADTHPNTAFTIVDANGLGSASGCLDPVSGRGAMTVSAKRFGSFHVLIVVRH